MPNPARTRQAVPFTTLMNPELLAATRPSCTRPVQYFLLLSTQWILPGLSDMVQSSHLSLSCFVSPFSCGLYVRIPLAALQTHGVPEITGIPGVPGASLAGAPSGARDRTRLQQPEASEQMPRALPHALGLRRATKMHPGKWNFFFERRKTGHLLVS